MDQNHNTNKEELLDNDLDIQLDKPNSSRFFFVLGFFGIFIFAWSGCYNLYKHKFTNQKDIVPVNESSLYEPKYK